MIHGLVYSHYFYMVILLIGIGDLVLADWRLKLVFFDNFAAAWRSISIMVVLLLIADIVGIKLGIFFTNQKFVTGLYIGAPNLPIEEIFFLFLLSYVTLVLYQILNRIRTLDATRDNSPSRHSKQRLGAYLESKKQNRKNFRNLITDRSQIKSGMTVNRIKR